MKLLINFASRSRPVKFHQCMLNLRDAFRGLSYEVLLKVDRTDPTLKLYLNKAYKEINLQLGYSDSKIHAINRNIPASGWDVVINTSDDINWRPNAGKQIIQDMVEFGPDIFLHYPEQYAEQQAKRKGKPSISIVSIMDRAYYNRFGYVYYPEYKSIWPDEEATIVARTLGRYKFINKPIFEHLHHAAGKVKKDELYIRNDQYNGHDKLLFIKRKMEGFGL